MELTLLFAPLLGAALCGLGGRLMGDTAAGWSATGLIWLSMCLAWLVFFRAGADMQEVQIWRWIESGTLSTDWSVRIDRLSTVFLVLVTTLSAIVHLFAMGADMQAADKDAKPQKTARLMAGLSAATFAMLVLVTADNVAQMIFGSVALSIAAYWLVGFHVRRDSANKAALRAYIVNAVGDAALILAASALYLLTDSLRFDDILDALPEIEQTQVPFLGADWPATGLVASLLLVAAMAKSALLAFHVWWPKAMRAPLPAAALVGPVTLFAAGVFLVCRLAPVFDMASGVMAAMALLGAITALLAASVAMVQTSVTRVIAYLAVAQSGIAFAALGSGAYGVALFHTLTASAALALLCLGAASLIRAMKGDRNMFHYGGLRQAMPVTFGTMLVATLSLTGLGLPLTGWVGFSGFAALGAVAKAVYAGAPGFVLWAMLLALALSALAAWRLMLLSFFGPIRGDKGAHETATDGPVLAQAALILLGLAALLNGALWYASLAGNPAEVAAFFGTLSESGGFGSDILTRMQEAPIWVALTPFLAMVLGAGGAYWLYVLHPKRPAQIGEAMPGIHAALFNAGYFERGYDAVFVRPAQAIGRLFWRQSDDKVISGAMDRLSVGLFPQMARLAGKAQNAHVLGYALIMVVAMLALVAWVVTTGLQ